MSATINNFIVLNTTHWQFYSRIALFYYNNTNTVIYFVAFGHFNYFRIDKEPMSSGFTPIPHYLPWRTIALAMGLSVGLGIPHAGAAGLKETLDWVPFDQLTLTQQQQLPLGSCGAYISPITAKQLSTELNKAPTEISSDSSETLEKEGFKEITLIGDVIVKQGYRQLTADKAQYNEKTSSIVIDGELTLRDPDLLLLANRGIINQPQDTLVIEDATYVIHSANIRGTGKKLSKEAHIISLQSGKFTQCKPGSNTWALKGSKIVIDTERQQGSATNVRLEIKGIPVFYRPYLQFPIGDQRQSGFLYPSIASSDNSLNVSIPYYFNLAPNYDLTLTPHFVEQHGTLLEANGRHLSRHFETDITLAHLSDDKGSISDSEKALVDSGVITLADATRTEGDDRWMANIQQKGGLNSRWFSLINYNEVSDNSYLNDFDSSTLNSNSLVSLDQQIKAGYRSSNWLFEVNTQQYQVLSDEITRPYKQLPQITLNGNFGTDSTTVNLDNEFIRFEHSDADHVGDTTLTGDRVRLKYSFEWENESDAGFFIPRVQARHLAYQLNDDNLASGASTSAAITVPQAVLDTGLYFERNGSHYQQTFEPRLFFFYSQFKDQSDLTGVGRDINFDTSELTFSYNQLFNDTRFSGGDRIDDANQLSIGLSTRFISQTTGHEVFSASLGKALYFDERRVNTTNTTNTDNNSPLAGQITGRLSEHWQLTSNFIYDDDANHLDDGNISLRYRGTNRNLINLNYRFLRDDVSANTIDQAEASIILPFASNHWQFIGHINYDYTNNRELEQLIGLEYNSCCHRTRFAYKRFLDDDQFTSGNTALTYDEGFILEFQFYGLGGTGKQLDKLLEDTVDGYEHWQASYPQ